MQITRHKRHDVVRSFFQVDDDDWKPSKLYQINEISTYMYILHGIFNRKYMSVALGIVAAVATLRAAVSDFFCHHLHNANASAISFQVCLRSSVQSRTVVELCLIDAHTLTHTKQCVMHEEMKIKYSYRACTKWDSLKMKIGYSHIENMCKKAKGNTNRH